MSTLSSAVDALEAASEPHPSRSYDDTTDNNLRVAVSSASVSNHADASEGTQHLDGAPQNSPLQFPSHLLSGKYKPFTPPAAPVPASVTTKTSPADQAATFLPSATLRKSYSTILTILESTHPNGSKTYTARTSPIVADEPSASVEEPRQAAGPPARFLERMHLRQRRWEQYRRELAGERRYMYLISVKRQRKLKMKKHKYKKLMRKTRNLRRRLDRN
ncbi:MAG: hypothetical protein M1832_003949 [Thelocarpon impressellum]|nr:MAG: hypothetical protein M1832_003949 [Thelocarpon impressellum]